MNKKRLLKLADLLEADAENKKGLQFDYFTWGWVTDETKPMSCGTSACALGLAALSGAFKRAGLGWRQPKGDTIKFLWNGRRVRASRAAMKTFGLSEKDSDYLFINAAGLPCTNGAKAELAVAKRIRDFVAAH